MTTPNDHVWGVVHSNIASENSGALDLDLEHGDIPLLSWIDVDSHTNMVVNVATIDGNGRRSKVSSFTLDYEYFSKSTIVDAVGDTFSLEH